MLMDNINEALLFHTLQSRFKKDNIYTNVGTTLIAINPFKILPLYTPKVPGIYADT